MILINLAWSFTVRVMESSVTKIDHRVDTVLGFFSSRWNWDPHPEASVSHIGSGGDTLVERGWGVPCISDEALWYSGLYVLCEIDSPLVDKLWLT